MRSSRGRIDLKSVLDLVLLPRAAQVLVPPLQGAGDSLVNTVTTGFVQSDAFKNDVADGEPGGAHPDQLSVDR
jgi:hypothetical protein